MIGGSATQADMYRAARSHNNGAVFATSVLQRVSLAAALGLNLVGRSALVKRSLIGEGITGRIDRPNWVDAPHRLTRIVREHST